MEQQEDYRELANYLRSAIGLLEMEPNSQLRQDAIAICDHLVNPIFRIAVFGPFNYGKSTLLNALLGNRTLPIDIIPSTGAAIEVKYGNELHTKITLVDGREISENGTDVLKRFAILDDQRCMRNDVAAVQVFCPHPFLKMGVELLDLPGTNDREEQDKLVRDRLLTADLVVQVLDARKLMTLGERENLRDWLLDRGIKTVIFVANFLNLMEVEEQKEVCKRFRFVAESFRSQLPPGISNFYRVDALPALRARLKGDTAAAQTSGLYLLESALQNIVSAQKETTAVKFPRILAIANQIRQTLEIKTKAISSEIEAAKEKQKSKIEIQQKAEKLIKQGFQSSSSEFQSWLYLPKLLERYQLELTTALQNGQFNTWELSLKLAVSEHPKALEHWVKKGCEFFDRQYPGDLLIPFPQAPQIYVPPAPPLPTKKSSDSEVAPVAIATGLGWLVGGPVGAAVVGGVTYLLNQTTQESTDFETSTPDVNQLYQICNDAARNYLTEFSKAAFLALRDYEQKADKAISLPADRLPLQLTNQHHQLELLTNLWDNINQELKYLSAKLNVPLN